jgi:nucleotide-binding universal stress UspA family protein
MVPAAGPRDPSSTNAGDPEVFRARARLAHATRRSVILPRYKAQNAPGRTLAEEAFMAIELKHLLVPVDFGAPSEHALGAAVDLARRFGSRITLVHVYEIPSYAYGGMTFATADLLGPIEAAAREHLDRTLRQVQTQVPGANAILRQGNPALEILAVVDEQHPDLVVIGTHGRTGVSRALLGSVAEKVVRLSPAPVLTMRETKAS